MVKKILILLIVAVFFSTNGWAGSESRHNFFDSYDPISTSFVYDDAASPTATGDQYAVNTYSKKSIQIQGISVNEYIEIRIEGRSHNQIQTPNWAVLHEIAMAQASSDLAKHRIIDVTEHIDWIRVGIRQVGSNAASEVDIEGIFINLER